MDVPTVEWPANNDIGTALQRIRHWVHAHPDIVIAGGAAAVATALAPILVPLILNSVGFGAGGVAAGSWAAGAHAALGSASAGGWFALAQSVGAGGALPLVGWLAGAGLGLSAGMIADVVRILTLQLMDGGYKHQVAAMVGPAGRMLRNQAVFTGGRLRSK